MVNANGGFVYVDTTGLDYDGEECTLDRNYFPMLMSAIKTGKIVVLMHFNDSETEISSPTIGYASFVFEQPTAVTVYTSTASINFSDDGTVKYSN